MQLLPKQDKLGFDTGTVGSYGSGHDGKATDLMFADGSSVSGTQMRRTRVRQIIR